MGITADIAYSPFFLVDGPSKVPGREFVPADVSDDYMLGVSHRVVPDEGLFEQSLVAGDPKNYVPHTLTSRMVMYVVAMFDLFELN